MAWVDDLSSLAGKYLDFRRVESQDTTDALNAQYRLEELRASRTEEAAAASPAWMIPAMIGGAVLLVVLLVRK